MMKVYKFGMLVASVGLLFGLMTGCGGGGGTDSIIPLAEIPADENDAVNYPAGSIEDTLQKENIQADTLVSESIVLEDATYEYIGIYEDATTGIDPENASVEELIDYLGEEKAEAIAEQMNNISDEKIVPATSAVLNAYSDMISSEEQIREIMLGQAQPSIAKGLLSSEYLKASDPISAVGTGTCLLAAGGIIATFGGVYATCADAIRTKIRSCEIAYAATMPEDTPQNVKDYTSHWNCMPKFIDELGACYTDFAATAYTSGSSVAAAGYKPIQFTIDYVSGLDLGLKIKNLIGVKNDTSTEPNKTLPNPDARIFVAQGENNTFIVPEGNWDFVVFADDAARQAIESIDISGDVNTIEHQITMTPIEEAENMDDCDEVLPDPTTDSSNIQVNMPGYTGPFVSNHTEMNFASLNDGPYIYPSFLSTDANSLEEVNYESDIFFMKFNTTLSAGNTYLLTEEGDGNANLRFTTGQIVDEDGAPIVFSEVSGSFTLTEYGTNVGDRLSGSFSCDVVGKRSEDVVINGNISGTFSGTLSATEINSAVSKSMTVSF